MKDQDKRSGANGFNEAAQFGIAIAVFIYGEITGIPQLDVGDVIGPDVGSVLQLAIAAPAFEFDDLPGGDAIDIVHEFAGIGSNAGQDVVEGAGAQLRRSSAAEFAQVGREEGIELRGAEVRNREFSDGISARSRTVRLESQRKKMVENKREFNRLARGKIEVQLRRRKRPTGHKDMVRTRRKIGENGVGRLIYNDREIGAEG